MDVDEVRIKYNIPGVNSENDIINIAGNKITAKEFIERYKKFLEGKHNFLVFWDDIVQATSFGLLAMIVEEHKLKDVVVDFQDYLDRDEALGVHYVYNKLKKYKFSKEYIEKYYIKNYNIILKISPKTNVLEKIITMVPTIENLKFVFRTRFDFLEKFAKDYEDLLNGEDLNFLIFNDRKERIKVSNIYMNTIEEVSFVNKLFKLDNSIFNTTFYSDITQIYYNIIKYKCPFFIIISTENHNGMDDSLLEYTRVVHDGYGLYGTLIYLMNEYITYGIIPEKEMSDEEEDDLKNFLNEIKKNVSNITEFANINTTNK